MRTVLAIVGPTASGKTSRAVDVARELDGEIVSGDSRQVYRGMDIGTGKDLCEYGDVPYHLIDIAEAGHKYNLFEYLRDASASVEDIILRGKTAVVCGGTGMYVESLLGGKRLPEVPANTALRTSLEGKCLEELAAVLGKMKRLHNVTDLDSCKRAIRAIEIQQYYIDHPDAACQVVDGKPIKSVIIGVDIPRDERRRRISARLDARLDDGMVDEVRRLVEGGVHPDDLIYYGLEYKFVTRHVIGELSFDEMRSQLEIAIHQFAKRQMTWFRGMERRGFHIHWLPYDIPRKEFVNRAVELLNSEESRL